MWLRKLYSNREEQFPEIHFRRGLNVVLGAIRQPRVRELDTHNLGKTTLSQVIDYCLLRKKDPKFFMFEHQDLFCEFVFFLEIESHSGQLITVRRSAAEDASTKIAFQRHRLADQDFRDLGEDDWLHWSVPFERSKQILDGFLALSAIAPWNYRQAIAYTLRTQNDYSDPFQLSKFGGRHADWKPFLTHVLGLDSRAVQRNYEIVDEIENRKSEAGRLRVDLKGIDGPDQLRGLIDIKQRAIRGVEEDVQRYDFDLADAAINRELVDQIDNAVADLNSERYALSSSRLRIELGLEERIVVDLNAIRKVFEEAKIYFGDQVRRDYDALEAFNRELSQEREGYLREELKETSARLEDIEKELSALNARRAAALVILRDRETFSKYKGLTTRLGRENAELESLERLRDAVGHLARLEDEIRDRQREREVVQEGMRESIARGSPTYDGIRATFDNVMWRVIGEHANLFTQLNSEGNPEFRVDIVDERSRITSAGKGYTYGRLMCVAFDLTLMKTYEGEPYPHFVYHDGLLESLDDRKKLSLLEVSREFAANGQHIITVIESELPLGSAERRYDFPEEEIILRLDDSGEQGRLFKMEEW